MTGWNGCRLSRSFPARAKRSAPGRRPGPPLQVGRIAIGARRLHHNKDAAPRAIIRRVGLVKRQRISVFDRGIGSG